MKICKHATCEGECRRPKQKKLRTPVRKVSKKMAKINREYSKLSKKFIEENPSCAIKSPDCTGVTQGVHHPYGRLGDHLMKVEEFIPACNPCNTYVESHDRWARDNGFKKSRLAK